MASSQAMLANDILDACSLGKSRHLLDVAGGDNGARVDAVSCETSGAGARELCATWTDPDFDPVQPSFYYARALENPTCRWSTYDALRLGIAPTGHAASTIQERAWSSPIWYKPQLPEGQ